mgnify:CR=1 FL=1
MLMNKHPSKAMASSAKLINIEGNDRMRSKHVWEKNLFPVSINARSRINWTNGRMLAIGAKSLSLSTDLREINSNFKLQRLLQKESRLQKLQLSDHDLGCKGRGTTDKLLPVTSNLQELDLELFDFHKGENSFVKLIYRLKYCASTLKSLQLVLNIETLPLDSVRILTHRLRQMSNLEKLSLAIYTTDLTPKKFRIVLAAITSLKKLKALTLKMKNLPTVSATAIVLTLSNGLENLSRLESLSLSFKCCQYWSDSPFSLLTTAISEQLPLLKCLSFELASLRFEMAGTESYLKPLRQLNQLKGLRLALCNLKNFSNREMKHIASIIQAQAFLRDLSLELSQLPLIPAASWGMIVSSLEALASPRMLNLNFDLVPKGRIKSFNDLDIEQLTKIIIKQGWTNLEYLRLNYRNDHNNRPQLIDSITTVLRFLPYLKELCLNFQLPDIYTDESLVSLSNAIDELENLQELEFTLPKSRNISHEGLAKMAVTIGKKIRLKALHLNLTNPSRSCENEKFFDVLGDSLVGLPHLQNLSLLLTRISINDDSCSRFSKALSQLKNLESFLWSLTYGGGP